MIDERKAKEIGFLRELGSRPRTFALYRPQGARLYGDIR
jgi:hypothetical protein